MEIKTGYKELNRFNYFLYSLKEWIPRPRKRDIAPVMAGLSMLLTSACATPLPTPTPVPKDNPPQITGYNIPSEINAGEEFQVSANVTDDYGVKEVYIVFKDGTELRTEMEKTDGEYKARLKLPSEGEYWASILAIDTKDQSASFERQKRIVKLIPMLFTVTNSTFHDYNGDGDQDLGEPNIEGIELEYEGGYRTITDKDGKGIVNIPAGSYRLYIKDASKKFRYILPSVSEVREIGDGLNENVTGNTTILIPLAEGFLTWPFPLSTDITGVSVHDNNMGIDIFVKKGTPTIAAAPLKIINYRGIKQQDGRTSYMIDVLYGMEFKGSYQHTLLMEGVKVGDIIKRGQPFGIVEDFPNNRFHLHFALNSYLSFVDSYEYWTVYQKPQYFR